MTAPPAPRRDPVQVMEEEYALPVHWFPQRRLAGFSREKKRQIAFSMLERVGLSPATRFVDVGCGDGRWTADIARKYGPLARVCGVDMSARAIAFARLICPEYEFFESGAGLAFPNATFDLATAFEVIEHVPDGQEEPFLAEIRRVVAKGGHLLLTTPSVAEPVHAKHFRHYPLERLQGLIRGAGFEVLETRGFMRPCHGLPRRLVRLAVEFPLLWRLGKRYHRDAPLDKASDFLVLARAT